MLASINQSIHHPRTRIIIIMINQENEAMTRQLGGIHVLAW
jgi:hypothetical protein